MEYIVALITGSIFSLIGIGTIILTVRELFRRDHKNASVSLLIMMFVIGLSLLFINTKLELMERNAISTLEARFNLPAVEYADKPEGEVKIFKSADGCDLPYKVHKGELQIYPSRPTYLLWYRISN